MKCLILSAMGWQCDDEYGHKGDMHSNAGDGFYAQQHNSLHRQRQLEVGNHNTQQSVPSDTSD